jgi:hypothetical protein
MGRTRDAPAVWSFGLAFGGALGFAPKTYRVEPTAYCSSLRAQRDDWLHFHGTTRGQPAGERGDGREK